MINFIGVSKFCCDDICLIENYHEAINDLNQTWDCHHKKEIELNLSVQELKDIGRYYNVPASELIFLTKSEHIKLHSTQRWNDLCFRKQCTERLVEANKRPEVRKHKSESKKGIPNTDKHNKNISKGKQKLYSDPKNRQKQSEALMGKNKNKHHLTNGIDHVFVKSEMVNYYLERGYHLGRK